MTHLDMGTQGAKRQSWERDNPREVLRRLVEKNPYWSRERTLNELKKKIINSPSYIDTIIEYWFTNNYASLIEQPERTERAQRLAKQTADLRASLDDVVNKRVKIALLEMVMPNGKTLGACTGAECKQLASQIGAWLLRISKRIKPTDIVADVLTETQVKQLYR